MAPRPVPSVPFFQGSKHDASVEVVAQGSAGNTSVSPTKGHPEDYDGWETGDFRRNPHHLGSLTEPFGGSPVDGHSESDF